MLSHSLEIQCTYGTLNINNVFFSYCFIRYLQINVQRLSAWHAPVTFICLIAMDVKVVSVEVFKDFP